MATITVLYEPSCVFCRLCKGFIERRDPEKLVTFFDINTYEPLYVGKEGRGPKPPLTVLDGSSVYTKYRACVYIARFMKQPWPFISQILNVIPSRVGNWGYDLVANHRDLLMKILKKHTI